MALPLQDFFSKKFAEKLAQGVLGKSAGSLIAKFIGGLFALQFAFSGIKKIRADLTNTIQNTKGLKNAFNKFLGYSNNIVNLGWGNPSKSGVDDGILDVQKSINNTPSNNQTSTPVKTPISTVKPTTPATQNQNSKPKQQQTNDKTNKYDFTEIIKYSKLILESTIFYKNTFLNVSVPDLVDEIIIYGPSYIKDVTELRDACSTYQNSPDNALLQKIQAKIYNMDQKLTPKRIADAETFAKDMDDFINRVEDSWDSWINKIKNGIDPTGELENKINQFKVKMKEQEKRGKNIIENTKETGKDIYNKYFPKKNSFKNDVIQDLTKDIKNYITKKNGHIYNNDIKKIAEHINNVIDDRIRHEAIFWPALLYQILNICLTIWSLTTLTRLVASYSLEQAKNQTMELNDLANNPQYIKYNNMQRQRAIQDINSRYQKMKIELGDKRARIELERVKNLKLAGNFAEQSREHLEAIEFFTNNLRTGAFFSALGAFMSSGAIRPWFVKNPTAPSITAEEGLEIAIKQAQSNEVRSVVSFNLKEATVVARNKFKTTANQSPTQPYKEINKFVGLQPDSKTMIDNILSRNLDTQASLIAVGEVPEGVSPLFAKTWNYFLNSKIAIEYLKNGTNGKGQQLINKIQLINKDCPFLQQVYKKVAEITATNSGKVGVPERIWNIVAKYFPKTTETIAIFFMNNIIASFGLAVVQSLYEKKFNYAYVVAKSLENLSISMLGFIWLIGSTAREIISTMAGQLFNMSAEDIKKKEQELLKITYNSTEKVKNLQNQNLENFKNVNNPQKISEIIKSVKGKK